MAEGFVSNSSGQGTSVTVHAECSMSAKRVLEPMKHMAPNARRSLEAHDKLKLIPTERVWAKG